MWIGFRVFLALIGFLFRRRRRKFKLELDHEFEGHPYWQSIHESKGSITGFSLGMPRRSPAWLRFHRENAMDRWVKRMGFAKEIETGDARFDRLVYVTSDHPFVERTLLERRDLRRAVCDILELGYERVELDGQSIVLQRESDEGPTTGDLELLVRVHAASAYLEEDVPSRFADPFFRKALFVEALIWSVFGYAVGGLFQIFAAMEDFHVSKEAVFGVGLAVAFVAFVGLIWSISVSFRGSSRGHRIIVESAVVLVAGLPGAGIQLVADTNRALDFSEPERVSATVLECDVREHRGKRGRRWYTYHARLARDASAARLPEWIEVTHPLCVAVRKNADPPTAEIWLGRGLWFLPWYRRITISGETWEAAL